MIAYFEQYESHFSGEVEQARNMLNAVNSFTEHQVQTTIKDFSNSDLYNYITESKTTACCNILLA